MKIGQKQMKYILLVLCAGLLIGVLEYVTGDDTPEERKQSVRIEWDLPTTSSPANHYSESLRMFADLVHTRTDGQVLINIHYGGALGYAGTEMISVVRDGLVPIADMVKHAQTGEEPFLGMNALPYLAPEFCQLRMLQLFSEPYEKRLLSSQNQVMLFQVPIPGQVVYSQSPIESLDDLKGMRIRVASQGDSQLFSLLGAVPVQMQEGEVITSLATGLIDGVVASSSAGVRNKYWELTSYAGRWNWHTSGNMVTVNKDAWDALPDHLKQVIEETAQNLEPVFARRAIQVEREAETVLSNNGMVVYDQHEALRQHILDVSHAMWDRARERDNRIDRVITDYEFVTSRYLPGGTASGIGVYGLD